MSRRTRQNFVSDSLFCFRACKPGPMAPTWCQHIYDIARCWWNMPANYSAGVFEPFLADSGEASLAPAIKRAPYRDPPIKPVANGRVWQLNFLLG
ncbi:hypothetical protein F5887DRAFT_589856 [Amanita rubescens]|nr:hypothetical protein F5887DRAFT_589856 [Amanita rubescens]